MTRTLWLAMERTVGPINVVRLELRPEFQTELAKLLDIARTCYLDSACIGILEKLVFRTTAAVAFLEVDFANLDVALSDRQPEYDLDLESELGSDYIDEPDLTGLDAAAQPIEHDVTDVLLVIRPMIHHNVNLAGWFVGFTATFDNGDYEQPVSTWLFPADGFLGPANK